ncbi:MAG: hypothetical protein KGJ57_18155 [Sphingomonadales bacterium]|nr:hypothetical protein [Sphingomonadales bacterium]MDE2171322.1 hypothetical protein [Sphingomonadales bacterium]
MTAPIILVEVNPRRAADGVTETVRLAGNGCLYPYFYGGEHWRAGISKLPTLVTELSFQGDDFGTGGVPQAAEIEWGASTDADLAEMSAYMWIDAPITVRIGPENADGVLPDVVLTGKVLSALPEGSTLKITLSDPAADLKKPLITATYGGTGGLDGPADWAGKVKRRVWGRIWNLQGDCIDVANNIYCFADPLHKLLSFDALRDKGAAAAQIDFLDAQATAADTFTALQNAVAPQGGGVACPSIACVKWWTAPAGTLTADLRGEIAGGYVETTAEIVARLVAAGPATPMADGTVAAATALRPAPVGWVASDESTTVAAMIEDLLGSSSLLWLLNAAGQIELHPWSWDNSVANARSLSVKRNSAYAPVGTRKLGFRRNETKMARGDLAGIVLIEDVAFPDGQALSDALADAAKSADWANVTGDGKPEDNATRGAPAGTDVGGLPAESLVTQLAQLDQDVITAQANIASLQSSVAAASGDANAARADAQTAIAGIAAEVTRAQGAEGVLTSSVGALQTSYGNLSATVSANFTALSNEDEALSASISTLTSNYNGLSASVSSQSAAISTLQSQAASVVQSLSAGSPNLLPNGSAEMGMNYWTSRAGTWATATNGWGAYFYTSLASLTGAYYMDSDPIAVWPNQTYTCAASSETNAGAHTRIEFLWYSSANGNDGFLRQDYGPNVQSPGFGNADSRGQSTFTVTSPSGAAAVRVRVVGEGSNLTYIQFRSIKFENGSAATPYSQEATARQQFLVQQTGDSSLAASISSLNVGVSNNTASISSEMVARANGDNALGSRIDALTVTVGNNTAAINSNQAANASAIGALSSSVNSLTASVISRPNMLDNPTAANGTSGWNVWQGAIVSTAGSYGEGFYFNVHSGNQGATRPSMYQDIPYFGGVLSIQADIFSDITKSSGTYAGAYVYAAYLSSSGAQIGNSQWAINLAGNGWSSVKSENNAVPAGTAKIRVYAEVGGDGTYTVNNVAWRRIKVEAGSNCTVYTDDKSIGTMSASITTTSTAVATLQAQAATFEQRLTAGSPNLAKNGSAELGMAYWTSRSGIWGGVNNPWGTSFICQPNADGFFYLDSDPIPVFQNNPYSCAVDAEIGQNSGSDRLARIELLWYSNSNGVDGVLRQDFGPNFAQPYFANSLQVRQGIAIHQTAPAGAVCCRVRLVAYATAMAYATFRGCKFEYGYTCTAYSQESTILTQQQVIQSTENGVNTALARVALTLDVNGYTTGWETANNGHVGSMKFRTDLLEISSPSGGATTQYSGGNWRAYDGNGVLRTRMGVWSS